MSEHDEYSDHFEEADNLSPDVLQVSSKQNQGDQPKLPDEYQALWELELWKRTEEAKWRASLKEKEQIHIAEAAQEWQKRENERENQFQNITADLSQLEAKVRAKALDLQKREQRLIGLEEELRQRINEAARQLTLKEEEITSLKERFNESRGSLQRENKVLTSKLNETREELRKTEEELHRYRREQDSKIVSALQSDVNQKQMQIMELDRKLDQMTQAKDVFKSQCEKLKGELTRVLKAHQEEKAQWEQRERDELSRLRMELEAQRYYREETSELASLKKELASLKEVTIKPCAPPVHASTQSIPTVKESTNALTKPSAHYTPFIPPPAPQEDDNPEISRLLQERNELLESGIYTMDDPLIKELTRQIEGLKKL